MAIMPDPDNAGASCTWRVENGSALRIYVPKTDGSALTVGASVILHSDVYPEYSGEYVVAEKIDFDPNLFALITTCIGTEFRQEV